MESQEFKYVPLIAVGLLHSKLFLSRPKPELLQYQVMEVDFT